MPVIPAEQRTRRCILIAAALLLILVPALGLRHLPVTRAQTTTNPTCIAPNVLTTTCTFTTSTAVAAGGTMTIQLTNPIPTSGASITALSGVSPGCVTAGLGTSVATVSCAVASLGVPSGTSIAEMVNLGSSAASTSFVAESVTYNANGAAPQVPPSFTDAGVCAPLLPAPGASATCTNTPSQLTVGGGTLTATVLATGGVAVITSAPSGLGPVSGLCFLQTAINPTATPTAITYQCGVGASIPAGTPIPVVVTTTGTIPLTSLVEITTENANGGTSGTGPVSTQFPSVLTVASCAPLPSTVGASAACPAAPLPPGSVFQAQAGFTLALQITAAVGQTLSVAAGGASPTSGSCTLATPLPTSATFPEGTLALSYACPPGGLSSTASPAVTVTDTNGVGGTPSEVITVTTPQPPAGIPAPTTQSVVFTVTPATPAATVTAGQGLQVTLTVPGQFNLVPGQAVQLLATASSSNEVNTSTGIEPASIVSFTFAFSDAAPPVTVLPTEDNAGASAIGQTLHTFSGPGPYIAYVQAVDSTGAAGTAAAGVNIKPTASYAGLYQPLPPAQAAAGTSMSVTLTAVPLIAGPGDLITFSFTAVTEVNPALAVGLSTGQPQSGSAPPVINGRLDFGDGSPVQLVSSTKPIMHIYASPGAYNATLTATDSFGNTGQQAVQVVITAPVPQPAPPASGTGTAPAPLSPAGTPFAGS